LSIDGQSIDQTVIISVCGTLLVALITITGNYFITWRTKKYEFKKNLYNTVFESAYKEWEKTTERVIEYSKQTGREAELYPLSYYLLYYSLFIRLIDKNYIREKDIEIFHDEFSKLSKKLEEESAKLSGR